MRTHYYRHISPPPGAIIEQIVLGPNIAVVYDTQRGDLEGEHMMILYFPDSSYGSYDIETDGFWAEHQFPYESYVFELNGIKYYISKGMGWSLPTWVAEWVNVDRYNMRAQFPYRFTPEEVLGYISNIERVDIRSAGPGDAVE
jgi:hypothetical protein